VCLLLQTACSSPAVQFDGGTEDVDPTDAQVDVIAAISVGTNAPGTSHVSSFKVLEDGQALEIVFGQQGLWMVVLAIEATGVTAEYADVQGEMAVDGVVVGSLSLKRQRLTQSEEGLSYLLNFFLVLDEPAQHGREGIVTMTLTPTGGEALTLTRAVQLYGGPPEPEE